MTKALRQHIRSLKQRKKVAGSTNRYSSRVKSVLPNCARVSGPSSESASQRRGENRMFGLSWKCVLPEMTTLSQQQRHGHDVRHEDLPGMLATAKPPKGFNADFPADGLTFFSTTSDPGNGHSSSGWQTGLGCPAWCSPPSVLTPSVPKRFKAPWAQPSTFLSPCGHSRTCRQKWLPTLWAWMRVVKICLKPRWGHHRRCWSWIRVRMGCPDHVKSGCHSMAAIPGAGRAESLNASVAGAIAIASILQQGRAVL